jgi:hypothetical protein
MNPGRDLDKPLVEIADDAPRWPRLALQAFPTYIGALFVLSLLRGLTIVFAFVIVLLLVR